MIAQEIEIALNLNTKNSLVLILFPFQTMSGTEYEKLINAMIENRKSRLKESLKTSQKAVMVQVSNRKDSATENRRLSKELFRVFNEAKSSFADISWKL